MGESTSKFDFERIVPVFLREPSRSFFFARIVPVESSQGGTGFCAKRPVPVSYSKTRVYMGIPIFDSKHTLRKLAHAINGDFFEL